MTDSETQERNEPETLYQYEYDPSLQEFAISAKEYRTQNPHYSYVVTGIAAFDSEGRLLLVQRSETEKAFKNFWEVPGGKVDDDDKTILDGAVRELWEETNLEATRIVRKVGDFQFPGRKNNKIWKKHIFEIEVKDLSVLKLNEEEHQAYLFASEEEVNAERAGDVKLEYITSDNKTMKQYAFEGRRKAASL